MVTIFPCEDINVLRMCLEITVFRLLIDEMKHSMLGRYFSRVSPKGIYKFAQWANYLDKKGELRSDLKILARGKRDLDKKIK